MPSKTNQHLSNNLAPNAIAPALNYKKSDSPWGLEAFYEGYRLVFSADFNAKRIRAEKWQKFFNSFKTESGKNPGSIINNVDLYIMFSKSAKHAWNNAYALAQKRGKPVGVEDIFLALLKESSVKNLLARLKVNGQQTEIFINNYLRLTDSLTDQTVKKIPFEAFALSAKLHNHKIGALMLLGGLLRVIPQHNVLQAIFTNIGLSDAKLEILAVWLLDLDYEFPSDSASGKLLFCLRQGKGLEEHFGYFFEFPAIEAAVELSAGQTLKDLQHLKALQLMVKAGLAAKNKNTKIISGELVRQATGK